MINFNHEETLEIIKNHAEKLMLEEAALTEKFPDLKTVVVYASDTFLTVKLGTIGKQRAQENDADEYEKYPHRIAISVVEKRKPSRAKSFFVDVVTQLFESYYYRYPQTYGEGEYFYADSQADILELVEKAGYYTPNCLLSESSADSLCLRGKLLKVPQDWLPKERGDASYYVAPYVKNKNLLPISLAGK